MEWLKMARWSPYAVGIGIGMLSWLAFLLSNKAIGCSTAFARTSGMLERLFRGRKTLDKAYYQKFVPEIDWEWMLVVGVVIGVTVSNIEHFKGPGQVVLSRIFAAFMIYVIGYNVYRLIRWNQKLPKMTEAVVATVPRWRATAIGIGMGFGAGLLGIGGGALAVPAQQVFLKMPLKNAIGNSACAIIFSAFVGSITKNITLAQHGVAITESLVIAATLIPTSFTGAMIGAKLTHVLPRHPVRIIFVLMLVVAAYKMATRQANVEDKGEQPPAATQPADTQQPIQPPPTTQPEG
jgi:uncharacterized membrane protein YfcA